MLIVIMRGPSRNMLFNSMKRAARLRFGDPEDQTVTAKIDSVSMVGAREFAIKLPYQDTSDVRSVIALSGTSFRSNGSLSSNVAGFVTFRRNGAFGAGLLVLQQVSLPGAELRLGMHAVARIETEILRELSSLVSTD